MKKIRMKIKSESSRHNPRSPIQIARFYKSKTKLGRCRADMMDPKRMRDIFVSIYDQVQSESLKKFMDKYID